MNTTEDFSVILSKAMDSSNSLMEMSFAANGSMDSLLTRLKSDMPMGKFTTELFETSKSMGRAIYFSTTTKNI